MEAAAYAERGVLDQRDALHTSGKRYLTEGEFQRKYPQLLVGYYRDILKAIRPE